MKDSLSVLVTGANGFIGSNLVRGLTARNHRVRSLVLKGTPEHTLTGLSTERVYADITRPDSLSPALEGIDLVYHLAALASDWGPTETFFRVNHRGTVNMLDASVRAGVSRFVHMSTLAVHRYRGYLDGDECAPLDAESPAYALSKIEAEKEVRRCQAEGRLETTIVRPGLFPFGPEDTTSFFQLARALERGLFGFVNGGKARLCVSYVENLVEGLLLAGTHERAVSETFILADDPIVTWRELIGMICEALEVREPRISLPSGLLMPCARLLEATCKGLRLASAPPITPYRIAVSSVDLHFSNRKAKEVLGYNPQISLREGVGRTVAWYRSASATR